MTYSKEDLLINKLFMQTLFVMIIAELSTSLASMLDGIIIARSFDKYAVASYGLTTPYVNMMKMLGGFFATGTQVVYSQYAARGRQQKANEVFTVSAVIVAAFGLSLAACLFIFADKIALLLGASKDAEHLLQNTSDYLRGLSFGLPLHLGGLLLIPLMNIDGDKKRIAHSLNAMLIVNTCGDLFVAFFFNGSMFGLALATSLSYVCSFIVLMLHFRKRSSVRLILRGKLDFASLADVAKSGIIPAAMRSFSMIRTYALNIIFITFAGAGVLAANTLVRGNIKAVPMCVASAIGTTILSISGVLYEECDRRGLRQIFRSVMKVCLGPCLLIAAAMFIFAPQVVAIFGVEDIAEQTILSLRCFCLGLPFICMKMFFVYYFQSTRKRLLSYYSSFAGEFLFVVSSAYLLNRLMGDFGLFICYPAAEIIYMISVVILSWIHAGHFPRCIEDLLFLDSDFTVNEDKIMDISISSPEEVYAVSERAVNFCRSNDIDKKKAMYTGLVVEEAAKNIFQHGQYIAGKNFVDLKIIITGDTVKMHLRDNCRQFNPQERADMFTDDKVHNIGLRIVSGASRRMNYTNLFSMNQFYVEI